MKKSLVALVFIGLFVALALTVWVGQHRSSNTALAYITTMEFSGTTGASFVGEYLQGGKRVVFSGILRYSLTQSNVSRLEIRKAKAEDTLVLDAQGGGSRVSAHANSGTKGLRLKMEGGWSVETLQ
jgi:hypothetical protein